MDLDNGSSVLPYNEQQKIFTCEFCKFSCRYDVYGKQLETRMNNLRLKEDAFLLKDPFTGSKHTPVVIGAPCSICKFTVCLGQGCSYFYGKRYCRPCLVKILEKFPSQVQEEAKRRFTDT